MTGPSAASAIRRTLIVIAAAVAAVAASAPTTAWATTEGADLALSASSLSSGTWRLTITNIGTEPALGAELRGTFAMEGDSIWTLTPAETPPCTVSGYLAGDLACPLGDLAVGSAVEIVADLLPCGTMTLTLAAVAVGDVNTANDGAEVVLSQLCVEAPPDSDECGTEFGPPCDVCIGDPEVSAGDDQVVEEGDPVVLDGSIFEGCLPLDSYGWSQVSPGDPPLALTQDFDAAGFTAPEVGADTQLTFRLTATAWLGQPVADDVTVTVRNVSRPQAITFADLPPRTYGAVPFALGASSTSGLPVTFTVGATDACTVLGTTLTVTGAGSCSVTASQVGDADVAAASDVVRTFAIAPAPLVITADDKAVQYGDPLPQLTATPSGLIGSDALADLVGTLVCSTPASAGSPPGTYPISCDGLSGADYLASYLPGQLTITAEDVVVRLAPSNPHAVAVRTVGGTAPAMTFAARITEAVDGSYGDVSGLAADTAFRLVPIAGGGAPAPCPATAQRVVRATATQPGFVDVTCTFPAGTRVDVYDVLVDVAGREHRGRTHGVLTVYDPAAGGTRGAGLVTNPGAPASVGEFAFVAKRLKNGSVQGRYLYIETAVSGTQTIVKGNEMSTLAVKNKTASITGKASVDGTGNLRYVLSVTDGAADSYGQRISSAAGVPLDAVSFAAAAVTAGDVTVGS